MTNTSLLAGALGLLSAATLYAENAVILEDFEDNIDSVTKGDWGGSRVPDGVALSQYAKTGDDDINVTHGKKSLQVDVSQSEGWVLDFKLTFSDEASDKLRAAVQSTDVARYILRYDIVFPGGTAWMNNEVFFGNINDQLDSQNASAGGKGTMSIALDTVTGLPEQGPITIRFADNFDATEDPFVGPLTLFVDNIRLVDTYAPGAKPVSYLLQSFEDSQAPTGGAADFTAWGGTTRTTYKQYTKAGADDIRVSEGTHALQVDYSGAGTWHADFTIPFKGTKLAEVLKLDLPAQERPTADQLARYTFRFDVTYPNRDENSKPSWAGTSYNTLAVGFPYTQAGRWDGTTGQRETVSITLDQIAWSDSPEGAPVLMFIANSDWSDTGATIYYDNFRLIDTGATAISGGDLKITSVQFDAKTSAITLKWDSVAGKTYAIDYTQNLGSWPTVLAPSVQGAQGGTTYTGTVPNAGRGFLRIRLTN